MEFIRPKGLLSGFHADDLHSLHSAYDHAGEQWAPTDYFIHWHEHPVWEFYFQVSGSSVWESKAQRYPLAAGDFLAVSPRLKHQMAEKPAAEHHFLYVALDPYQLTSHESDFWRKLEAQQVITVKQAESLADPFRYLIREVSQEGLYKKEGLEIAARSLLLEAMRLLEGRDSQRARVMQHPAVAHCRELIELHPEHNWTLDILGRMAGLSPNYLLDLFRKETAKTPHRYLIEQRIKRACQQLKRTDQNLTDISISLGFGSSQHFSNCFRQYTGMSPSVYRKRVR